MTDRHPEEVRVRRDLLEAVEVIENTFIEVRDGCRLAARIWRPKNAGEHPVPAILEYIPYRKRDFMRARDEPIHAYFAAHGYAAVRVDVRGSGDSDGVLEDEYCEAEQRDALDVIAWIAAQPWCDGAVGMIGISWGGFNALQVAALRPPALKAVISLCATDDRYADDAHYMGGCLLNENLQWGAILMTYCALPPDPRIVGERWRTMWHERLRRLVAFPAAWMRHPWRDRFWKHGSVCEDYAAIECPVYVIGGWADGYSNAVPRLLAGLHAPRKGLVGPWAHVFPHEGVPGPAIGFLQEALRWWDHWLKGEETGIMGEPVYRVWMQERVGPAAFYHERPGRWVAEREWPSPRIGWRRWHLDPAGLADVAGDPAALTLSSPQTTGLAAGEWCAFGAEGELPPDQRVDDGRSLVFDSPPLAGRMEILGAPRLSLELASDRPVALIAARLEDVAPDGASTRVTYAVLNLTHRRGHARPAPLVPGRRERVRIALNDVAHAFAPGHRIRIAISSAYWPLVWPPPEPVALTLWTGAATLELPVRPPSHEDDSLAEFPPPERAPRPPRTPIGLLPLRRKVEIDLATGETVHTLTSDGGEFGGHEGARLEDIDLELRYRMRRQHRIRDPDPTSARTEIEQAVALRRRSWAVTVRSRATLTADATAFHFTAEVEAREGDGPALERRFEERIPRRLV